MPLRLLMWYLHTLWWLVWMVPNAYQSILPKVIWIRIIFFPWHFWPLDCSRLSFWLTCIIPLWISFHEHCQIQSGQSIYWRAIFYGIFLFVIVLLWCSLFFLASSLLLSPLSFVAYAIWSRYFQECPSALLVFLPLIYYEWGSEKMGESGILLRDWVFDDYIKTLGKFLTTLVFGLVFSPSDRKIFQI